MKLGRRTPEERDIWGKSWKSYGIHIKAPAGVFSLSPRRHVSWEAPVVHDVLLSLYCLSPSVKHTFLFCDLASLLSICSLFPLVLKQAVYCVCSAEQPALKAQCVCVCCVCIYKCVCLFQPACQTTLIPSEARPRLPSASPLPLYFSSAS